MDFDKFRKQIDELKNDPDQYFYMDSPYGSLRFCWDVYNNHYQIGHALGLVTLFDDFVVSKDQSYIAFYRWMKYTDNNGDDHYIQSISAILCADNNDRIVNDMMKKVKE